MICEIAGWVSPTSLIDEADWDLGGNLLDTHVWIRWVNGSVGVLPASVGDLMGGALSGAQVHNQPHPRGAIQAIERLDQAIEREA